MAPEPKPLAPEVKKALDDHNAATAKAEAREALEAYLEPSAVDYLHDEDDILLVSVSSAISHKRIADALERWADFQGWPTKKAKTDDESAS